MSKVITFSMRFPVYHPRAGERTFFPEKFWASHYTDFDYKAQLTARCLADTTIRHEPKHHTIRAGKRWKVGNKFSPRVWSGKPYNSKQIVIAPDVEIKKVWDIRIEGFFIWINKEKFSCTRSGAIELASNDGLDVDDFWSWFPNKPAEPFDGQIICWNENINY